MFITFPNTEKKVESTTRSEAFIANFKVFGNVMKHSRVFDISSQSNLNLPTELEMESSKSVLLKIAYPNHGHGSGFFFF